MQALAEKRPTARTPDGRGSALSIAGLEAWYGESHILHGMTFELREGEVLAMLGRNGSGRTTTLRAVMGLVDRRTGSIKIGKAEVARRLSFAAGQSAADTRAS